MLVNTRGNLWECVATGTSEKYDPQKPFEQYIYESEGLLAWRLHMFIILKKPGLRIPSAHVLKHMKILQTEQ